MKDRLIKIFNGIFAVIFIYIIINSIFKNTTKFYEFNNIILILGVVGYITILYFLNKLFSKIKESKIKYLLAINFCLIIMLQFICINLFKVQCNLMSGQWDFNYVYGIASTRLLKVIFKTNYLCTYTNNIGITLLLCFVYNIAYIFGISDFQTVGMVLNIIVIDISLLLTYLASEKLLGKNKAYTIFFVTALMTPIYLYAPIFYTDTLSMLFPILIFYLYLCRKQSRKKLLYNLILPIVTVVGMYIKMTVLIEFIALILYDIINIVNLKNKKENLLGLTIILVTFFTVYVIINFSIDKIAKKYNNNYKEDLYSYQMPFTHWIMMGLGEVYVYNQNDIEYTQSFYNKDEKKKANLEKIKYYLKNNDYEFYRGKLIYSWGDGTFYVPIKLERNPINRSKAHEYILLDGEKRAVYMYWTQIQLLSTYVLIVLSSVKESRKKENGLEDNNINRIAIFGLILFFMIWEPRSRYLVNYIPILIMCIINVVKNDKKKLQGE